MKIKLSDALDDSFIGYYDAVVQQKTIDGKNYWSLYSFKKSSSDITFQKTNGFYDVSPTIWYHKPVELGNGEWIAQGKDIFLIQMLHVAPGSFNFFVES